MLGQGCSSLVTYKVLTLLILPVSSGKQACRFLLRSLPFLKASCRLLATQSSQEKRLNLVLVTLGATSSISYLATVRSLAQSQHLLQGLRHDLLPLVQKLLFPVTQAKAKAQVQVSRAVSDRSGGGVLGDCSLEESLRPSPFFTGADPHSVEPLRKTLPEPDMPSATQAELRRQKSPDASSLAQEPSS